MLSSWYRSCFAEMDYLSFTPFIFNETALCRRLKMSKSATDPCLGLGYDLDKAGLEAMKGVIVVLFLDLITELLILFGRMWSTPYELFWIVVLPCLLVTPLNFSEGRGDLWLKIIAGGAWGASKSLTFVWSSFILSLSGVDSTYMVEATWARWLFLLWILSKMMLGIITKVSLTSVRVVFRDGLAVSWTFSLDLPLFDLKSIILSECNGLNGFSSALLSLDSTLSFCLPGANLLTVNINSVLLAF